jgi:hypothetical protein
MADRRRRLLLHEFELQCDFALRAYRDAAGMEARDEQGFWYAVQTLLNAAAQALGLAEALDYVAEPFQRGELRAVENVRSALERWGSSNPAFKAARSAGAERSVVTLFGHTIDLAALLGALAELRERARAELRHFQEIV